MVFSNSGGPGGNGHSVVNLAAKGNNNQNSGNNNNNQNTQFIYNDTVDNAKREQKQLYKKKKIKRFAKLIFMIHIWSLALTLVYLTLLLNFI